MVEIIFLGVGEAFDENFSNTSMLIRFGEAASVNSMLLDCGYSAPPRFWKEVTEVDSLDAIWISHFHADHAFGLPALLVRFMEEGRAKSLTIMAQRGIEGYVRQMMEVAYGGFYAKIKYKIHFLEIEPKGTVEYSGLKLRSAENAHSNRDLALRIEVEGKSVFYSGDGAFTPETKKLAKGASLIIHEAFDLDTEIFGHGTVLGVLGMAKECGASNLALVHFKRSVRAEAVKRLENLRKKAGGVNVFIPEPGEIFEL